MSAWIHSALLAYTAAAAAYLIWLVRARAGLASAGRLLLALGLALHLGAFLAGGAQMGFGIAGAGLGAFSWRDGQLWSWLAAALVLGFLVLDLRYRLPVAGCFVAPLAVVSMVPTHLTRDAAHQYPASLVHSGALAIHVGAATVGTAALSLAFALAVVYLAGEHQLKHKRLGRLFARMPSLDLVDRVLYGLAVAGFIALSVAIGTGSLVSTESQGSWLPWGSKQLLALFAWGLLAASIQARLVAGWRGRRLAILVVTGFLLLVGSYGALIHSAREALPAVRGAGRSGAAL